MASLRKNVASQNIGFCLNAKADGTPVTAGGAGTVVIDGGAQASCGGTFTHKGTGQWNYAPTQAETNGTNISFAFTGTGAIQVNLNFYTDNWDTSQPILTSGSGANQIAVSGSGAVSTTTTLTDLTTTTYAEPSGPVAATSTLKDDIVWLKTLARNKITQTATTETLFKDDGSTTISTSADSDDGTTFTRGKWS